MRDCPHKRQSDETEEGYDGRQVGPKTISQLKMLNTKRRKSVSVIFWCRKGNVGLLRRVKYSLEFVLTWLNMIGSDFWIALRLTFYL